MGYIPTEWETGDIITAEKLNNMERGIADAGVKVVLAEEDDTTATLAATYNEIAAAMSAKIPVFIHFQYDGGNTMYPVYQNAVIMGDTTEYQIMAYDFSSAADVAFVTDSADGYPAHTYE